MASHHNKLSPLNSLLLFLIVGLVLLSFGLLLPPPASPPISHGNSSIPLGNAPITHPNDIQGSNSLAPQAFSPQNPLPIKPNDLNNLNF